VAAAPAAAAAAPSVFACAGVDPERTVVVSGVSKAWAMTGFRVGWLVTRNRALAEACAKLAEASISCGVPFAQHGALVALTCRDEIPGQVADMVAAYRARRDAAVAVLERHGMREYAPEGAFYILVRVGDGVDTVAFCRRLLAEHHVAVSPGSAFGRVTAGHVRVSLASTVEDIEAGVERLCRFVQSGDTDTDTETCSLQKKYTIL
jgi:aspartate aminotransferase